MNGPRLQDDGRVVVETPAYRLEVSANGLRVTLGDLVLRPYAAFDTLGAVDETLAVLPPRVAEGRIELERRSTRWDRALTSIACTEDQVELTFSVAGSGELTGVSLLALRSLIPDRLGWLPSGYGVGELNKLFCANPAHATGTRPAHEPAVIGATGDGEPGRHHWFFTPAPLYLAWAPEDERDWLDVGFVAPVEALTFVEAAYVPRDGGFHLQLDYEGHTRVDGAFTAPSLLFTPGVADPYRGLRRHRDDLVARAAAVPVAEREQPDWWTSPIFCGWGAQFHLYESSGVSPMAQATQENYDAFLTHLEGERLVPGIVVLDDKWQTAYGTNQPDEAKWPDLKGWIAARRERGQHVLLWWKAWDPEGLPPELCVRNPEGVPIAVDPGNEETRAELQRQVARMLGAEGLDADGLKIDFTARTPSGHALSAAGSGWGIALLHELLAVVYTAAKAAKPDALIITQTPHPAFVDVTDMIRLNDIIGGHESVVPQMRFRAELTAAACPELLIDTDDWRIPSLAAWREYLGMKAELGVPSLYYATHVDATGERLEPSDYEALRDVWQRWEASRR
ncbi:MAG TPA: hypothetical protein VM049_06305 [Gaiellaceae bacterium]|nr:hypothetical protein [Gaiellaceae bacterium]